MYNAQYSAAYDTGENALASSRSRRCAATGADEVPTTRTDTRAGPFALGTSRRYP